MDGSVTQAVRARIAEGHLEPDPAQMEVAAALDDLAAALLAAGEEAGGGSLLSRLFGRKPAAGPRGLYIHGDVGRGKTMLMDLFFDTVPVARKRRVHFHGFMADVHERVHAWRQKSKRGDVSGTDPIAPVAADLAAEARLLCFDEFAVTDIADAMILGRLFTALFGHGVTVVATSNVEPSDLYKGGLNRALFLPFLDLLQQHVTVLRLLAQKDFRLTKLTRAHTFQVPANAEAKVALDRFFLDLSGVAHGRPTALPLLGRSIAVPEAAGGVARFAFADLCEAPLGATDFLAIARAFHSVVVDEIRVIRPEERNVAKRFITMIDAFYDRHVKLIASAEAEPQDLYQADEGREAFEFDRTVSRLIEMRSDDYLGLPHGSATSSGSGSTSGLVET